jgi:trypsin
VTRDGEETPLLLTAAHVVGSLSAAHPLGQTEVLLGAMPISPASGDPHIGDVIESHPSEPCDEVELDACLVRVDDDVTLSNVVRTTVISRRPRDLGDESEEIIVYKRGINAPGLTEGLLDTTPESLRVELPQIGGPPIVRDYLHGWFVYGADGAHPFARAGDSGSIVVDEDDCVVGMVVALRSKTPYQPQPDDPAFVVPIASVLERLGIRLIGPDRACTLC